MLPAHKELGSIFSKRKKSIISYNLFKSKEEKKIKRQQIEKFVNESNQRVRDWLIQKKTTKERWRNEKQKMIKIQRRVAQWMYIFYSLK